MTPRENFITALEGKIPKGRVPHFELVFFLTMEVFGKVHPTHRYYSQWVQMSGTERAMHRSDMAQIFVDIAQKYEHSAIFIQPPMGLGERLDEELMRLADIIRKKSSMDYFLMVHGDATYGIPKGDMFEISAQFYENPKRMKDEAKIMVEEAIARGEKFRRHGVIDGFALCTDYCFNDNPFFSPAMFDEFVTPYLKQLISGYKKQGFYVIKHTDGNIVPILNSLVEVAPHALHSLDPQGGVDIAEIKCLIGNKVCLIGNVNCGLMDTGTDQEVAESVRYALQKGMPGGGYIFSTSNCIYTGMDLKRYELMLDIWRREGNYS
jgi:uroporphyrinogen decarboxylase